MAQKLMGSKPSRPNASAGAHRWRAVAIRSNGATCEAAQACRAARFLCSEAPRLPLAECTTANTCTCVYKHLPDRRAGARRQEEVGGIGRTNKAGQERRKERDRRNSDPE
jgi:hypothetical protein